MFSSGLEHSSISKEVVSEQKQTSQQAGQLITSTLELVSAPFGEFLLRLVSVVAVAVIPTGLVDALGVCGALVQPEFALVDVCKIANRQGSI